MQIGNAFVLAAGLTLLAQEPVPLVLKSSRDKVEAGQSAALTWAAEGDAAFLTGVGKVPPSGSQVVTPLVPTKYVLVVQRGARISTAAVNIDVTGARGDSGFPDIDEFSSPAVLVQRHSSNYAEFLAFVHQTLQDTMSFHVRGDYLPRRPSITLYTDRRHPTVADPAGGQGHPSQATGVRGPGKRAGQWGHRVRDSHDPGVPAHRRNTVAC